MTDAKLITWNVAGLTNRTLDVVGLNQSVKPQFCVPTETKLSPIADTHIPGTSFPAPGGRM